ncbi:hypothetical protein LUZ60_014136 [Juncus effusus]|nr:hypothetical protein LUZ60_014136 [Juncus effusus]
MGGKKKSFIDKKRSATFTLISRDSSSSSSNPLSTDRVFVRTDNHSSYSVPGFEEDSDGDQQLPQHQNDQSSIFDDALEDSGGGARGAGGSSELPEDVRRDILELGLPDDGYNYLLHLREIRNQGAGSAYYDNPKAQLDQVPLDVKAYDASRLKITENITEKEEAKVDSTIYNVASKAAPVRVQKAVDPDVVRLLDDDSDLSRFGSDVEDLEEDFVVTANQPEGDCEEGEVKEGRENEVDEIERENKGEKRVKMENHDVDDGPEERVRRMLDDEFDLLALAEYDDDDEEEEGERENMSEGENELLADKLKDALKDFGIEATVQEEKYKVPADSVTEDQECAQVILKTTEYAHRYLMSEDEEKEVVLVSESSDESEKWDCDTIVSTYSNLENHPGKIDAPGNPKRRFTPKLVKFPGDSESGVKKDIITLGGKGMLPVNYLPQRRRMVESLVRENIGSGEKPKRKVGEESKDEKKERKATIKNERREARKSKKELKDLYKGENKRAQKVAAFSGPPSVHLM